MVITLTDSTRKTLEQRPKNDYFEDVLSKIDQKRFRGLGQTHTRAFINHGITFCESQKFRGTDEFSYIMFLMTILGSYFFEDPRYRNICEPIYLNPDAAYDRIDMVRMRFADFVKRNVGENYEILHESIHQFNTISQDRDEDEIDHMTAIEDLKSSFLGAREMHDKDWDVFMNTGVKPSMKELNVKLSYSAYICTSMAFCLGTGFYKDPLYPWIQDKVNAGESEMVRMRSIAEYAQKRMVKEQRERG